MNARFAVLAGALLICCAHSGLGGDLFCSPAELAAHNWDGGTLEKDAIRQVIRSERDTMTACYWNALKTQPTLSGDVTMRFIIAGNGTVARACIVDATLEDGAAQRCVAEAVAHARFPPTGGGGTVVVTYPFTFGSRDAGPDG